MKGKGFNGAAKDRPLSGIVLATNRTVPLLGLINKWLEGLQAYANDKGMDYVAHCIEKMVDLGIDDFQPEEIDMSDCTKMVTTRKMSAEGTPLEDVDGNILTEEVKLITDAERFKTKSEL